MQVMLLEMVYQDTAGLPLEMSARENSLIYSGTYARDQNQPTDLIFE